MCEVICRRRGLLNVVSLVVLFFTSDGPRQLWSPLLPSVGQCTSSIGPAPRRYGHMAAVNHRVNRCGSDSSSSHSAPFPLSVFPPSIKTDKVKLGLISPVADNRSLARPTEKLYCSIVIDGNHRWALITAAGTWCSICFMLFHSFHKAKWAFCVMCSYFTVIRRFFFFSPLFFFFLVVL